MSSLNKDTRDARNSPNVPSSQKPNVPSNYKRIPREFVRSYVRSLACTLAQRLRERTRVPVLRACARAWIAPPLLGLTFLRCNMCGSFVRNTRSSGEFREKQSNLPWPTEKLWLWNTRLISRLKFKISFPTCDTFSARLCTSSVFFFI